MIICCYNHYPRQSPFGTDITGYDTITTYTWEERHSLRGSCVSICIYVYLSLSIYIYIYELERYREDQHGPRARMTRTNRDVYTISL